MKQLGALAPALRPVARFAARNPFLLIGAAVVGVAGMLAWRNREKIAEKTAPLIEDARVKGEELIETAKAKGEELVEQAKATTEAVVAKAKRTRKTTPDTATTPTTELH
jgi:predicted negative regulator of RcsB-dependent stress response